MMTSIRYFLAFVVPVLLWLGAIVGVWMVFGPETFWQRVVMAIIEFFVAIGVGAGCFLLGLLLYDRAETHERKQQNE